MFDLSERTERTETKYGVRGVSNTYPSRSRGVLAILLP